jgi:ubiquitin C-terminal hydrolase
MTPEREARLETLPPEVASEDEWKIYKMRNDSIIVDLFQGQYRNRLECLTCHKVSVGGGRQRMRLTKQTSTTYDTFMYLSLPVPAGKSKVVIQELIDEFVKSEKMEGSDAWWVPLYSCSHSACAHRKRIQTDVYIGTAHAARSHEQQARRLPSRASRPSFSSSSNGSPQRTASSGTSRRRPSSSL